jgi:Tfp pilus assembly protein PilF
MLLKAAHDTIESNPDKGLKMVDQGLAQAKKIEFRKGVVFALYMKGKGYEYKRDIKNAIKWHKEGLDYSIKHKMAGPAASGLFNLGKLYGRSGATDKALEYMYFSLSLSKLQNDSIGMLRIYQGLATYFYDLQDYDRSEYYAHKELNLSLLVQDKPDALNGINSLAVIAIERHQYRKALEYLLQCEDIIKSDGIQYPATQADIYNNMGLCYDKMGNKDRALHYYLATLDIQRQMAYTPNMITGLTNIGELLMSFKRYGEAEQYLKVALGFAKEISYSTDVYYAATNLSVLNEKKHNYKEAYEYQKIAIAARDSAMSKEKLASIEELSTKYRTKEIAAKNTMLQKENALQALRLRQKNLLLYGSLIGAFLLLVIAVLLLMQNKLLRNQQRIELAHKQLYAQMNPHFIFNCLSSIQHFILENDIRNANKYLTNFASLMRQTLDNSKTETITLREEIKYMQSYLSMEHLRFENKFTYSVECAPDIDTESIEISPMMVQPFAENAIKHGLANYKHNEGRLLVRFYQKDEAVYCEIDDNGIGREQSQLLKEKNGPVYRSQGMEVTRERMELVSKIKKADYSITIIDKKTGGKATGTTVILRFPTEA